MARQAINSNGSEHNIMNNGKSRGNDELIYLDHSPKTVALVGMGPSIGDLMTDTLTQEFKPEFADEVWAINMASNLIWHDVVFWMDDLEDQENYRPGLFKMLRRRGQPVITSKRRPDVIPNSYDYPIQEVGEIALKCFGKPYLNNAVAQAVAYAIWKKVETLKFFGCDFTYPNREYAESGRACVEAWMALASMAGMNLVLSPNTSLMDSVADKGVYGYAKQPEILLPDGRVLRHNMRSDGHGGNYVPEDSTKQTKEIELERIPGEVPGTRSNGADPAWADNRGNLAAAPAAPPAVG